MRGHLVGFHFCPVLLSGAALFLVAFSSSLHIDLSRDEVFERVEGNTWKCYTSVITPWYIFFSILVVTINRVSQFSLVPPLYSCSDDWSYLRSLWKPGDPAPPARLTHPSHPSFQAKNGDLFLTSAQRFSENIKFMISCLSIFLIWDWRMLWILQIFPKSKAI